MKMVHGAKLPILRGVENPIVTDVPRSEDRVAVESKRVHFQAVEKHEGIGKSDNEAVDAEGAAETPFDLEKMPSFGVHEA